MRSSFFRGLNQLLPQEQDGHYPSHWRVNQSTLQQVRQLVGQMEKSEDGRETHAIATRELLFMQLLVLLRRSSLVEGLEDNNARLNHLMAWLEDHFAEDVCWETLADDFSLSLRTLHRQLKHAYGPDAAALSQPAAPDQSAAPFTSHRRKRHGYRLLLRFWRQQSLLNPVSPGI